MLPHVCSRLPATRRCPSPALPCWGVPVVLVLGAACAASCYADRLRAAEPEPAAWIELFNGRDLEGWEIVGQPARGWRVADNVLETDGAGGWLSTTQEFSDFELELEFYLAAGSNSGLFLRAPRAGQSSRQGMEIQLIDDATEAYGPLEPWQLTGSLYHVQAATPGAFTEAEMWQSLRVVARGWRLTVVLNDRRVLDVDLDGFPELEAEHPGLKRAGGYVGLQNYGGRPVRFRKLRIRELR